MRGFHHRIPSIANEGLLNDSIYAEVNSAIELLDPATVELIAKTKPKDKVILISDALNGTNIKGDHFYMGGKRIDIDEDGIAKDKDGILAGSIKLLGQVVRRLVDTTHMTFSDFIKFASENPARNLKVENDYKLNRGLSPNFVVWNKSKLTPERTFIKGE
jgi:N-acetylglucosamine-6-phosphate deacetylase